MKVEIIGNAQLYFGDCMEYMAECKDKAFDLAIVDPPYGIGGSCPASASAKKTLNYSAKTDKGWDKSIPSEEYFIELFRVSKNQIIWGANYFTKYLPPAKGWVCWYKTGSIKNKPFSEFELAYTSFKLPARHFTYQPRVPEEERIHPTQKPVELYEWLLSRYATPGDCILDTHGGSGSSVIACLKYNYPIVWIEKDAEYYEAAVNRIRQAWNNNQQLF